MKKTNATMDTILSVNEFVEVVSAKGNSSLIGKSKLSIDGEEIEVYGSFSNDPQAVEACILFEGGEGDLTKEKLYPQLLESFGLPNDGTWKYWQICGEWNSSTTIGDVIRTYNEYPSGYWETGAWILATPEEMKRAERARKLAEKKAKEELKKLGFAYCPNYTKDNLYEGLNSYHNSHRDGYFNVATKPSKYPFKVGVELEVCANSRSDRDKICRLKSNWFFRESDSSLESYGVEFITIPLRFEDATNPEFWKPFTEWLSAHAKSWNTSCCGLHVHIGNEIFSMTGLDVDMLKAKLAYAYNYNIDNDPMNKRVFGRDRGYNAEKLKTRVGNAVETLSNVTKTKSILKDKAVTDSLIDETKSRMKDNRYFDINYTNRATTEFRKGRGSINAERIVSIVWYCYMMTEWTKKEKWENLLDMSKFVSFMQSKTPKTSPFSRYITTDECDA